jgi:16S rRNA (adenine1518-N6/adenine1519-N6)-dimethyltransferase
MLRVSLKQILPADASIYTTQATLLTRRPEQLSIPEFVELTNLVGEELKGI